MANLGSVDPQKQRLSDLLQQLRVLIKDLSSSLPIGDKDGLISKNFSSREFDKSEGPYFTFNKAWERTFQVSDEEKVKRIAKGKYGLDLVHSYVLHFSTIAGIEANGGLHLMAERVSALINFIRAKSVHPHSCSRVPKAKENFQYFRGTREGD